MKKGRQSLRRFATVLMLLLLTSLTALAQTSVNGRVTNSRTGAPVIGASITVKGTTTGTQTDANGAFSINVPSSASILVISSIGFATQEIAAANAANVVLVETATSLQDVVVVAYGTRKKSDLTGSVTAVTAKDFQKGNINSSEQLLQGKVAGLEVTTGGGAAGGGSKIRIRSASSLSASNDPLIVIDGVPVESNGVAGSANLLNTINPNDIESMSVLKDASATALYGSRATNGVIIITTKKGTTSKPTFNFNTKVSLSKIQKKVDVLSGDQIREIVNGTGNQNFINMLGTANTDWQDQIYQDAMGYDNNLSVAGRARVSSNFQLPYRLSAGYLKQDGILKTNTFDRLSGSLNLSPKMLNDHLSFNINAKYAQTKTRFADEGAIGSAVGFDPTQSVMGDATKYGGYWEWIDGAGAPLGLAPRNPLGLLELRNNKSTVNRFIGNVQMDYKMHFLPDLHLLVNVGMDNSDGKGTNTLDSSSVISVRDFSHLGSWSQYKQEKSSKLADVQLFYQKDLGKGNRFDVLVGHGYQEFFTDDYNFYNLYQNMDTIPGQRVDYPHINNGFAIESYIGRLNFTFIDDLLFTASLRRDESSKFSKANRVGYFPSFAFAWRLKQNAFNDFTPMNELKLRMSWGITGQQDGINWNYYLPLYYSSVAGAMYQFGDVFYQMYRPSAFNPDLKWETTTTSNIGLDYGFFNNRISGSVDVYSKVTKDLLSNVDIAPGAGYDITQLRNIGSLRNYGVEIALNTVPVRNMNGFTFEIGGNLTYNKSKITKLYSDNVAATFRGIEVGNPGGGTGNRVGVLAEGYAPYSYLVYKQVYGADGKPIEGLYEDVNRDGQVNDADRVYFKKAAPDFLFGLATTLTYNKFSVGLTGHGMAGNYLYNGFNANNGVLRNIQNPVQHIGNASPNYLETRFSNNRYQSDYYIENASFFRFDNLNVGYNAGQVANGKFALRLNASIQNLGVITKYSGNDPESANVEGIDNNIYPRPRIYSLGASIDF